MIPKVAYFYWGSETMSFLRYMTFASFRAHNPDWRIVLVTRLEPLEPQKYDWAETQDFMFEPLEDYFDRLNDLGVEIQFLEEEFEEIAALDISDVHTSDILAWYILARKGGIVSDTDIIYTRSFDYERFKKTSFGIVCFEGWPKPNYMPVSFMISQPNLIYDQIYKASLKNVDKNVYESAGTICIEKSVGSFEQIKAHFTNEKYAGLITRLPDKIVFPFAKDFQWGMYSNLAFEQNNYSKLHEDCIGIHWYAGAPGHQRYNRAYRESTYKSYNNTISTAIDAALRIK